VIEFLYQMGYLEHNDGERLTVENLGLKGILATEINEGHPILMTELYQDGSLHSLTGDELVCVLSCFQESKDTDEQASLSDLHVSAPVIYAIQRVQQLAKECEALEQKVGYPIERYWKTSTMMVEPMRRWMEGEHASALCVEYNVFEGNFIRSVMKIANMLDEWLSLATYCQHTEQVEKINEVRSRIVRDIVLSDSLYLHL
jgi:antiviral helicase SKI2